LCEWLKKLRNCRRLISLASGRFALVSAAATAAAAVAAILVGVLVPKQAFEGFEKIVSLPPIVLLLVVAVVIVVVVEPWKSEEGGMRRGWSGANSVGAVTIAFVGRYKSRGAGNARDNKQEKAKAPGRGGELPMGKLPPARPKAIFGYPRPYNIRHCWYMRRRSHPTLCIFLGGVY
jgi:hypothetical protein